MLNEIFWNYSIITQEKSQFDVLKNIIIPLYAQLIFTNNPELLNSKLIFHFYESISNLFLEKHKAFLSSYQFLKKHQISFTQQIPQHIADQTVQGFHNTVKHLINQERYNSLFMFSLQRSQSKSPSVIKLVNENPTNSSLLFDSILWSIFKADLTVLLKVFEKIFLLKNFNMNLNKFDIQQNFDIFNNKTVVIDQDFSQTAIEIDSNLIESNINYNKDKFVNASLKTNFNLAATPNFILTFNSLNEPDQVPHFLKIDLSTQNNYENNYIYWLQTKIKSQDYFLTSIGNDALIADKNGNLKMYNLNCKNDKFVSIRQALFTHISLPFVSDGYYIYSILNAKEIVVYSLMKGKNSLSFVKKIFVNESTNLDPSYNDCVLSTRFTNGVSLITNGIVLEIISPETFRNSNVVHFARVISLITGNHIKDFRFELPFPIHSISFDPLSRRIWTLTMKQNEAEFNQFRYTGPEPSWITGMEITMMNKFQRYSNFSLFIDFIIDYVHSIACQFFGAEFQDNNAIPSFLISSTNIESVDLILTLLSQPPNNVKYAQLLFILLSFQIKYLKLNREQLDAVFNILKKYISNMHLYNFFVLFIIQIAPYLKSNDLSRFFGLLFELLDPNIVDFDFILNLLLRLEKFKKFPYILDNNYPTLLQELLNQLSNEEISLISFNFMMRYQASLFLHYSRIYKFKSTKIQKIETATLGYTSLVFCKLIIYLQNIKSVKSFQNSDFSMALKKLLIDLRLTADSSTFTWALLPILQQLLKEFPKSRYFKKTVDNPLYLFFMDVFSLYIFNFKRMYSFSDLESTKKHFQFLINEIKEEEKNVSEVFNNNLNDNDFVNVIKSIYTKVPNPINKRLTQEDKDFEKIFFLSLIYKTQSIQDISSINNQIKSNGNIQIPQSIKQIAQTIYRVRSNLKSKRQNGDQSDYLKLYQNYVEKTHFLLKLSSEKLELKEISDFLNSDVKIHEIIQEKVKLDSVKKNFDLFIPMANSFIIQDHSMDLIYLFIMNISDNSDILYSYDLVKKFTKIDFQSSGEIIANLLKRVGEIPLNPIISFICSILLMLTISYNPEDNHQFLFASIVSTLSELCQKSHYIETIVFKSSISLFSHFNRILNNEKLFIIKQNEKEILSKILNSLDLKYSMSFTMSHSLYQGLFNIPKSLNFISQITGFVGQPKFHSFSLVLFDYLQFFSENDKENEFITFLTQILDTIGTILSGSNSANLLQIAVPVPEISNSNTSKKYVRTATSQLACVLDLIQLIRRLIIVKESKSSKIIFKHFKWISEHFQLDDEKYMKQLYAMLAVISNTIKVIRPYSIVKTNDNKTYFVLSLDEINQYVEGLLLPISKQQIIKHQFDFSSDLRSLETIQYNLSLLKGFELPFSLFKKATHIDKKQFSDSLFKFYALQCVRENILDSDHGKEFSDFFFSKIKNKTFKNFMFSNHCPTILYLLKKSLSSVSSSEGIFTKQLQKPSFYHVSFTQIVFNDDFQLTETEFRSNRTVHVFTSSVLNDHNTVYFCLNYEEDYQNFEFGIICHSVDHNKKISITYSSQESKFFINGEKVIDHKLRINTLIECRYIPSRNLISFADSANNSLIFSCDLGKKYQCSFIILIFPKTSIKYFCDLNPKINCFLNSQRQNQGGTTISRSIHKNYNEEIENIIHYTQKMKKLKYQSNDLTSLFSVTEKTDLFTFAKFKNLPETDLFMAQFPNAYFISLLNVYSSPIQLSEYIQIHDVSGQFNMVKSEMAIIENCNSIPAFNFQKYYNLPSTILNSYISEACEFYQQEIMTLFTVHVLINSKDICSTMNQYFVKTSAIINFITSLLLMLEPIRFSNLEEKNSPIDFTSFNGFETCYKTDLYDYFAALKQLIDYFQENEIEKFIYKWFKRLKKDFQNKYMHFVTPKNSSLITVRSSIIGSFQSFDVDDVSGWIIFPFKFGCYEMPSLSMNHLVFPKTNSESANYSYSASKILKIQATYPTSNELITFGILPIDNKSNESLFYSFYHLAVSFKYFVLFSQKANFSPQMNHQLWKLIINSITAGSPFFYTHLYTVLMFMDKYVKVEMTPENVSMFNCFSLSNSVIKQQQLKQFISRKSFQMKYAMSYQLENCIIRNIAPDQSIQLQAPLIPNILSNSSNSSFLAEIVPSILLSENTKESPFPYYLTFNEWSEAVFLYPPCDISVVSTNSISITFTSFVPEIFKIHSNEIRDYERVTVSDTENFVSTRTCSVTNIDTKVEFRNRLKKVDSSFQNRFFIKFGSHNISQVKFIVSSSIRYDKMAIPGFIYRFRDLLMRDAVEWKSFTPNEDQQILSVTDPNKFSQQTIETRFFGKEMVNMNNTNHRTHLLYFRHIYLLTINFLLMNNKSFSEGENRGKLERFLSSCIFERQFLNLVYEKNGTSYARLTIYRQKGLDYRNGLNRNDQNSMIGQFSLEYIRNPSQYRNPNTPFRIDYYNERGVDVGGLMRDFFTELTCDINTPRVGLFIQAPNGRNHEGEFQDSIVPAPAPEISRSDDYYRSVGSLLGIAIRSGMKQPDLVFSPFIWSFLITGKLEIEDVYSIDKSFMDVTTNLLTSAESMTSEEFDQVMSSTVVTNIRGAPIEIDLSLSKANCQRFVAMCNEFRLNELKRPLTRMRMGFWENLNINVPPFVTPSLLEFLACGSRIITVDDMRRSTTFIAVNDQQKNFFWEVVSRMSNEERKKLIHFATGLNSIGKNGLSVDPLSGRIDMMLPTASTCFFKLHLPSFSSADKMFNAFILAINETGTFENS